MKVSELINELRKLPLQNRIIFEGSDGKKLPVNQVITNLFDSTVILREETLFDSISKKSK